VRQRTDASGTTTFRGLQTGPVGAYRVHLPYKGALYSSDPEQSVAAEKDDDEVYEQALLGLRNWYTEWAELARLVVKRRDHLIGLGLAERRSPGATGTDDEVLDDTPFLPDPPAAPPAAS
jgi:hypothetical protein